jgi:hypothetical protein
MPYTQQQIKYFQWCIDNNKCISQKQRDKFIFLIDEFYARPKIEFKNIDVVYTKQYYDKRVQ